MKNRILLFVIILFAITEGHSQTDKFWKLSKNDNIELSKSAKRADFPENFQLFDLDLSTMRQALSNATNRSEVGAKGIIISIPNANGSLESFKVYEASNFEPALQAQFPDIKAYAGVGVNDAKAQIRISLDSRGIQTMVMRTDNGDEFMEPYSANGRTYAVYRSQRNKGELPFTCSTVEQNITNDLSSTIPTNARSSAASLLTFRLALSCTAEYSAYFGATSAAQVANVLAAFNATITRVNGVFEKDFAIHLNIIANTSSVIYYDAATDPYTEVVDDEAPGEWNAELQSTLTAQIGEANYDVGHLFGASGGGGNAGCIGCVCNNGKGSGYTSPSNGVPSGDTFDIDFVAHELGHQFGANHTFTHMSENNAVNLEPGSGSTIMGYAGITSRDVQKNSDSYFHAGSIAQVQANMATKTCPTVTALPNVAPVVNAGADFTIPKSTPFALTGSATDASGGALSYTWEQYDDAPTAAYLCNDTFVAQGDNDCLLTSTKLRGPLFRSYSPTASPTRYFPKMSSVLEGSTITNGLEIVTEALPSIARTLNFRLTVRNNVVVPAGQTNFDDMIVTVDDTKGPLKVTSQAAEGISLNAGTTQTITWDVNNTNTIAGGTNVDILLSTDGGQTFSVVLLANTPNDGTQDITIPNGTAAPYCRIMVKASNSIFFNVNSKDFAIGYVVTNTCNTYNGVFTNSAIAAQSPLTYVAYGAVNIPDNVIITNFKATVNLTHPKISDLRIALVKPGSTSIDIVLYQSGCTGTVANMNATFDDNGVALDCAGITGGNTYKPFSPLSVLNGMNSAGNWRLAIADLAVPNNGTLNSYSYTVCSKTAVLGTESFKLQNFVIYPNPNKGNFTVQFDSASNNEIKVNVHDIQGRQVFAKSYQNTGVFNQNLELKNIQSGVYLVTVQDGARKEVKKIVVE
ncbi:reprolysin-like metallopeptidase [Flavobacterium sp. '19STA2R22 D10 B1']|uniref:zinc-dependent metalloprotease n=1 Tax=Flavobacterium aerium TaxID=3037261 RepID=UPI00278BEC47|nr:zinc-dependent metalloprotease family protein [Flavobacterium sp. '19STA2R22 D10 B1']